jgi:hypothetical protein
MTALARTSSNYKRQIYPLVREDAILVLCPQVSVENKLLLAVSLKELGAKTSGMVVNRQS